jgi:hypothetical protein
MFLAFMLVSCLAYSWTLMMEMTCSSKTSDDFNGLHHVISQKAELFTVDFCLPDDGSKATFQKHSDFKKTGMMDNS